MIGKAISTKYDLLKSKNRDSTYSRLCAFEKWIFYKLAND